MHITDEPGDDLERAVPVVEARMVPLVEVDLVPDHELLVGARYVFTDSHPSEAPTIPQEAGIHWIGGGVGWLGRLAPSLDVSIELLAGAAVPEANGTSAIFFIAPVISIGGVVEGADEEPAP